MQHQDLRKIPQTCFEGPFGEVVRASGPMAKANAFRFSTTYQDNETDLIYYGYRYYNSSTGRCLSRDPSEEAGGLALYVLVQNDPVTEIDSLGLVKVKKDKRPFTQELQRQGQWGWTTYEGVYSIKPARLKARHCGHCEVKKKPELTFTVIFIVVSSGKQTWKETAVFDGVVYPNSPVYVSSGIAAFSRSHERKRFAAWEKAFTSFFGPHFEDSAVSLTAPTCPELQKKIDELFTTAWYGFDNNSPEKQELERTLLAIGAETISVERRVKRSGFGNVSVQYDLR